MRITVKHFDSRITIEVSDEIDLHELVNIYKSIAIALGYQESNWNEIMTQKIEVVMRELSDEEIKFGALEYSSSGLFRCSKDWANGAKWYREQLKQRQ